MVESSVGGQHVAAQSDQNGNGSRIEKAAESVMLRLVARWMMALGIPVVIAVVGWGGREIVSATNANTFALVELKGVVSGVQGKIDGSVTLLNSRIDAHVEQLKSLRDKDAQHDSQFEKQSDRINNIQQQIWQAPTRPR